MIKKTTKKGTEISGPLDWEVGANPESDRNNIDDPANKGAPRTKPKSPEPKAQTNPSDIQQSIPLGTTTFAPSFSKTLVDKDKYFGPIARKRFFGRHNWLSNQHSIMTTAIDEELGGLVGDNEYDQSIFFPFPPQRDQNGVMDSALTGNELHDQRGKEALNDEGGGDEADSLVSRKPLTARTQYLSSCIRQRLNPLPSLIVRKTDTKALQLQHMGIGDRMGEIIAEAIAGLPDVESVNLSDNNLTDDSLGPIMLALVHVPTLLELDISRNKVDEVASTALASYLSSSGCTLRKLVLHHADVNDAEADDFITALKSNKSLTHLDMSHNLLGTAEAQNAVNPDVVTAGESMATLLRSPACCLQTLNLSWNMVRLSSAVELCSSLSINSCLTSLDLSFNAIGEDGGIMLGDAITVNKTLKTLDLTSNAINARATFTIAMAMIANTSLEKVVFDRNPIGESMCKP